MENTNTNIESTYEHEKQLIGCVLLRPDVFDELDDITPELISKNLLTKDIPDPDLLIRTGGEQRISNYLLWQCAYTEFYSTDALWPAFDSNELEKAIEEFNKRQRRFGV